MPSVQINGGELYYESHGDGEPVLLIAGFACDHSYWSPVLPALSARHRVIMFDNRGTGRTTAPVASLSMPQMAADAAALLEALDLSSAHVVGHSMGGIIAQELAFSRPARVTSLTLISSWARLDERGRAIIELWGELPKLTDPRTMGRLIAPWMYTNRLFARPGAIDTLIDDMLAVQYPPTLDGIQQQSRAIRLADTSVRLGQIRCPTLVVVGREDILLPVAYSQALIDGIPGSEILVLEQTGHGLLIESPQQFVDAFHYFLTRRGFLFGTATKHES